MALISIVFIVVGFLISVYAGVVLSLSNKMQTKDGELRHSQINLFSYLMALSVILVIAGVLGYYYMRDNLPYYVN